MIAPMVKFSFAVYHVNYEEFLDDIQEIGTVHIKGQKNKDYVKKLTDMQKEFGDISNSFEEMKKLNVPAGIVESTKGWKELLEEFQNLSIELNHYKQEKEKLSVLIQELEPWGNYSSYFVEKLETCGIKTRFFKMKTKKFNDQWLTEYPMEIISHVKNDIFLILFGKDNAFLENAEEIDLPEFEIHSLNGRLAEMEEKIKVNEEKKELIKIFENLWEKYKVPLRERTQERDDEVKNLNEFLERLRYYNGRS